ncbi:acyl--CoA ligase family protein [Rhodococcus sp. X156]|uniref:acyl--CoA ligase family protein n=1 Tax=Rhodococcus sp. X156 TaxID=2499145 RepID=UPI000FD7E1EF|nr:acyl--CoA ligase family protein [Rhodococcus sp. X156]
MTTPFGPVPLTPTAFLDRARVVHTDRLALVDGDVRRTYGELAERCDRLAGALASIGVRPGDRVSVLAPNSAVALEAHYGVPMAGAVLNALNTRLSAAELAWIVTHAGSVVLVVDADLLELGRAVHALVDPAVQLVVAGGPEDGYEALLAAAEPLRVPVTDEWSLLSLNYTSGTTGKPKGVMYSHRGAYLQALAMTAQTGLDARSVYLWTLPMFHCNGWCFPWAVTAAGGVHHTLRTVAADAVWQAIREEGITHLCAAPTVLVGVAGSPDAAPAERTVTVCTGGAPPSPALLERMAALRLDVTHLYGLTETYGPAAICDWRPEWDDLDAAEQARLRARQGVANLVSLPLRVVDSAGADVPADASTTGEVLLRGNNVMLGYYRDPDATRAAEHEGWFRTGDIGVLHPDGYVELRDRSKDVIISGGENIASIEVEQALDSHPAVLESAVVAAPDPRWGESVAAFVVLREGAEATERELIDHVRARLAHFKAPKQVHFGPLPKTGTGKIQKFRLRGQLHDDGALSG